MKNLKTLFVLSFVVGVLGISQALACTFPGGNSAARSVSNTASKTNAQQPQITILRDPVDQGFAKVDDLVGRYASVATATLFDPTSNRTLNATCVGVVIFDGRGHFTDKEVHSYDGFLVHDQFTGTYAINADGTGTMHFVGDSDEFDYEFVVANGFKEITFLVTLDVPGLVSYGTLKKQ